MATMSDFKTQFHAQQSEIKAHLTTYFDEQIGQSRTIDEHLVEITSVLKEFCLRGGKALSPFLLHLAYKVAGGTREEALLPIAGAIELHHKYLLALDDIADRDEERYGGPTLEYVYRELLKNEADVEHRARTLAMFAASHLNGLGKKLLFTADFPEDHLIKAHEIMQNEMFRDTLAGWLIHYYQNTKKLTQVTKEEFTKGLELVTARYKFDGPFKIGCILADCTDENVKTALATYAKCVGTAFQAYDDILGLYGDTVKTGKPVGNDLREGKKTLLVQVAYERCSTDEKKFFDTMIGDAHITHEQILKAAKIITDTGSLAYSQELAKRMVDDGIAALSVLPDSDEKAMLETLAIYIITREK